MERGELSCQPACRGDADLLAEDSAHRKFKPIPATRSAKARSLRHPRCEVWIMREVLIDRLDICSDVEQATHAVDDCRQRLHVSEVEVTQRLCCCGRCVTAMLPTDPPISTVRR